MTINPIPGFTAAMRDACAEIAERQSVSIYELHDAGSFNDGCAAAADAILAMPVAPPFPEPMRETPEIGDVYYVARIKFDFYCIGYIWQNDEDDRKNFDTNQCYQSRDETIAYGKCIISLFAKTEGGV